MRFEHGRNAAARIKAERVGFTGSNRDRIEKKTEATDPRGMDPRGRKRARGERG
ncbi:hypothetical protein [Burkholderia pseudomallei]|uniref:hypothetical protein n=1 Tax=Burkholderia pseudomallei TaxID=28450 RepID=UPI0000F2902A|nr:hypothetical protein [Burkholderia pseudomallei]ABN86548.1 hypothetical protein BURPS668_A3107 [Burkholderia pseudomallei 668]